MHRLCYQRCRVSALAGGASGLLGRQLAGWVGAGCWVSWLGALTRFSQSRFAFMLHDLAFCFNCLFMKGILLFKKSLKTNKCPS